MSIGRILCLLLPLCAAAQQPASVRGRAVDSTTGLPLPNVHIRAFKPEHNLMASAVWGAMSDDHGNFSIASIPPGEYLVIATHAGYFYVPTDNGKSAYPGFKLTAGQHLEDFRVDMAPRAVLSGRVFTEDGQPLDFGFVHLETASEDDMAIELALQLSGTQSAVVRHDGQFRFSVPPGKYRLRVQRGSAGDDIQPDGTLTARFFADTYYPGAPDEKSAGLAEAVAGRETSGLDIHIGSRKPLSIAGTVAGIPPGAKADLHIMCRHCNDSSRPVNADGTFLKGDLGPDSYYVFATSTSGSEKLRSPTQVLELHDSPVARLVLQLLPAVRITGTVQLPSGASAVSRLVHLELADAGFFQSREEALAAAVSKDGTFSLDGVSPNRYYVSLEPMPKDGYIKSLLPEEPLREWDVTHRFTDDEKAEIRAVLDLRHGAAGIKLKMVVGPGAGISGKIPSGFVGVMPEGKTDFNDMIEAEIADGAYSIHGLPPGRYRLISAGPDSPGLSNLEQVLARAKVIELKEGEHLTLDIDTAKKEDGDVKK